MDNFTAFGDPVFEVDVVNDISFVNVVAFIVAIRVCKVGDVVGFVDLNLEVGFIVVDWDADQVSFFREEKSFWISEDGGRSARVADVESTEFFRVLEIRDVEEGKLHASDVIKGRDNSTVHIFTSFFFGVDTDADEMIFVIRMEIDGIAWDFEFAEDFRIFLIFKIDNEEWVGVFVGDKISFVADETSSVHLFAFAETTGLAKFVKVFIEDCDIGTVAAIVLFECDAKMAGIFVERILIDGSAVNFGFSAVGNIAGFFDIELIDFGFSGVRIV